MTTKSKGTAKAKSMSKGAKGAKGTPKPATAAPTEAPTELSSTLVVTGGGHGDLKTDPELQRTLPSATFLRREDSCFFYPFGNSVPEDLFLHIDLFASQAVVSSSLDSLLVGSGDLRNVLFTLAEAKRKLSGGPIAAAPEAPQPRKVSFYLNDHQPEVLARNIVLLHAIVTSNAPTPTLVRNVAQFWYSLALDAEVAEFWRTQMTACLERSDDAWLAVEVTPAFPIRMAGATTVAQVKHVWRTWIQCDWGLAKVTKARETFLRNCPGKYKSLAEYARTITESYVAFNSLGPLGAKSRKDPLAVEAEHLVQHGRLFNLDATSDLACNPSMLLTRSDGTCFYAVHYGTLPMEGHVFNFTANHGIEEGMWRNLMQWIECLHSLVSSAAKRQKAKATPSKKSATARNHTVLPIELGQLVFNADHCLAYMEDCIASPTRFDIIDTSNMADHCGLLNLLIHASVLLKPVNPLTAASHIPHVITTSFLLGHACSSRAEYLAEMLAMDVHEIPILIGLRLLEHTDGASSWANLVQPWAWSVLHVTDVTDRGHHRFTWLGCPTPPVPVSLSESPALVDTLVHITETFCTAYPFKSTRPGGPFSNGALLGKLLTYALATGRIAWTHDHSVRAPTTLPLSWPTSFWHRLLDSRLLQGTVSEVLVHSQLNGLEVKARDMDDAVVYVEATFPLDFGNSPTPSLVAWVQYGPVTFYSESLALAVDGANKSVRVAVYLPGFMWDWDLDRAKLSLQRMERGHMPTRGANQLQNVPLGNKFWTLAELGARQVPVSESPWWSMSKQLLRDTQARALPLSPSTSTSLSLSSLAVTKVVDQGKQMAVHLSLDHYGVDAKVALPTADEARTSRGAAIVKINGVLQRFWLACPVWLANVKISRKDKFVLLIVTKQVHAFHAKCGLVGLPFHQSVHGLYRVASPQTFSQGDLGKMLGIMFGDDEIKVKGKNAPRTLLNSPAKLLAFDVKESVQILFVRAFEGHKFVMLSDESRGGFGIVLINQAVLLPPTRSSKGWTPALDIVFTVVPPSPDTPTHRAFQRTYLDAMGDFLHKHMSDQVPMLKVADLEAAALCDLLDWTHLCCGDKTLPDPMPGRMPKVPESARRYLRRGILTPLYPADGIERSQMAKRMKEKQGPTPPSNDRAFADAERKATAMLRQMMASGKDPLTLATEMGMDLSKLQLS